jgi:dTDP-glucose 4,6-dehydratase
VNIGRGEGVSIGELAGLILQICGSDARVESQTERLRPDKSEVQRLVCGNRKAREVLGWFPQHSLREGLEATVEWMRANLDRYKANLYNL